MARDGSLYGQVTRRRRGRRVVLASLVLLALSAAVWSVLGIGWPWDGVADEGPDAVVAAFAAAWAADDPAAAPTVGVDDELRTWYRTTVDGLDLEAPDVDVVAVAPDPDDRDLAEATVQVTWALDDDQVWAYRSSAEVRRDAEHGWRVAFEPSTVHPELAEGETLVRRRIAARRGDILGGDGRPLVTNRQVVNVGVQPSRATDPPGLVRQLESLLDVDADALLERIEAADEDAFVPVITLREADFAEVEEVLRPLPGTVFAAEAQPLAPTREFARALLGTAGPVTAELMDEHPGRYRVGDVAGLSGLQHRFEDRLRGDPGVEIVAVPGEEVVGSHAERPLHRVEAEPGYAVQVSLDERVQLAADAALAEVTYPSALVAIRVSDGHVLAVANGPGNEGAEVALKGQYSPGSTFKVVTAAALLSRGLTPDEQVDCPHRASVDGRPFSNAEDAVLGRVPFRQVFAQSCNTAFVTLSERLASDDLRRASVPFGFGAEHDLGVGAYTGQVPENEGPVDLAAATIGQGRNLASPLAIADLAATVARGHHRTPRLLLEPTADDPEAAPTLDPGIVEPLRAMMREVVTDGSGGALADVPGGPVHGKTGTAEYGDEVPPRTHAWFAGYQDDLAFAVLVAETEDAFGGRVAAPVAADFLTRLHGG